MARGQQKLQSQAKAQEKQQKAKKQQGHNANVQKKAAQAALVHVCTVCKAQMPDPKTYRQHFENKHPKNEIPSDLKEIPNPLRKWKPTLQQAVLIQKQFVSSVSLPQNKSQKGHEVWGGWNLAGGPRDWKKSFFDFSCVSRNMSEEKERYTRQEFEELLLYSSRHGDFKVVSELLKHREKNPQSYDVNCKGKTKNNLGWTPLHLATYFGHLNVVELLLRAGCDVNSVNDVGDTGLHKAAFVGREDIVLLLLQFNASVSVANGEGQKPFDVTKPDSDIHKILLAALAADVKRKEERLLSASRENDLATISLLLRDPDPPAINCTDNQGNSCLHCASYRGHKEAAILLLQNGIDPNLQNNRGQLAVDLARDIQMQQVLNVKPVKMLQMNADRFEGQLLKRSRFLGWKPVWAILERGVLTYFNSRGDGSTGLKRKDFKYLDGAKVTPLEHDHCTFIVHFSDGAVHRLSVIDYSDSGSSVPVERQKWINALNEHIAYTNHYMGHGQVLYDSDEDQDALANIKPLGSMKESLQDALAHKELLGNHIKEAEMLVQAMGDSSFVHNEGVLRTVLKRFQNLYETSSEMVSSLNHCVTLFAQQEELRILQMKQEQEKCRVLEEALNVLAKEHHELEQSLVSRVASGQRKTTRSPRFYDTSDDEFYDAFEADSVSETLVTAGPGEESDSFGSGFSRSSSSSTLVSFGETSFISAKDAPPVMQSDCWLRPRSRLALLFYHYLAH
ncbi:hypothetical protein RUM44_004997 [Polyplax serrata]|uniref:PH domain-containing protein n=1 Tax=Polyplax serrata TaxID=468196 RepID=A0ABR1AWP5_POLSC